MEEQPKVYIIAGCNGAGKTTAAMTLLPEILACREFVNADEIARGLSPLNPESVAIAAGRLMLQRIAELASMRESFAIETTLATRIYISLIREWRDKGYEIRLSFFRLATPEIARQRVAMRVAAGGHRIPDDVIVRRFEAGWRNFERHYKDIVDDWVVYDNSGNSPVVVDSGSNDFTGMKKVEEPRASVEEGWPAQVLRGLLLARDKLVREARLHDRSLVIYEDGQIKHIPAKDIKLEGEE
jgi:predicted ABC-type ATPase